MRLSVEPRQVSPSCAMIEFAHTSRPRGPAVGMINFDDVATFAAVLCGNLVLFSRLRLDKPHQQVA